MFIILRHRVVVGKIQIWKLFFVSKYFCIWFKFNSQFRLDGKSAEFNWSNEILCKWGIRDYFLLIMIQAIIIQQWLLGTVQFKCLYCSQEQERWRSPSPTVFNSRSPWERFNFNSLTLDMSVEAKDHIYRMVKERYSNIWPNQTIVSDQSELTILLCQSMNSLLLMKTLPTAFNYYHPIYIILDRDTKLCIKKQSADTAGDMLEYCEIWTIMICKMWQNNKVVTWCCQLFNC